MSVREAEILPPKNRWFAEVTYRTDAGDNTVDQAFIEARAAAIAKAEGRV